MLQCCVAFILTKQQGTHVNHCDRRISYPPIVQALFIIKMEKTEKQKQEWKEFKEDLLGSMDLELKEIRRMLNTKDKYIETKTMDKCLKHFRSILHSHKILLNDHKKNTSSKHNASLEDQDG